MKSERFGEAAAVRMAIAAIEDKDSVQGLMRALDEAIKSERCVDVDLAFTAARAHDQARAASHA